MHTGMKNLVIMNTEKYSNHTKWYFDTINSLHAYWDLAIIYEQCLQPGNAGQIASQYDPAWKTSCKNLLIVA